MPCPEFEDLLAGYADLPPAERQRVDAHLHVCPSCRGWFETLCEIDAALVSSFEDVHAPASLATAVRRQTTQLDRRPVSAVPEILDFVGWIGVIGAVGLLAYFLIPSEYGFSTPVLYASSCVLLCVALSVTIWALRGNES